MKKYIAVAFPDEDGNKREKAVIEAKNHDEAQAKAWRVFPEHHEVGVWEMGGGSRNEC